MKDVTRLTRIQCGYLSKMEMQGWIGDTWWHSWSWLRISPFPNLWWLGETSPPHDVLMHRGWRFGDGRLGMACFFCTWWKPVPKRNTWRKSMEFVDGLNCFLRICLCLRMSIWNYWRTMSTKMTKLSQTHLDSQKKYIIFDIVGTWYQPDPPPALWYPP